MCEQAVIKQDITQDIFYFDIYSLPGFVSWWKFDETYGANAVDSIGNNNGTLKNMANDRVPGKSGNALEFDGSNDYVQIPDSTSLDITQDLTITAWINSSVDYSTPQYVVGKRDDTEMQFGLLLNLDEILFYTFGSPDQVGGSLSDPLADKENQWIFVAGTVDRAGNVKVYLNGLDVTFDGIADPITTASTDVYVGARGDGAGGSLYNFNGQIDEVMIFSTALSAQNISDIYDYYT